MSRLIIADPGLSGPIGHHLGYSQAVAEAAEGGGMPALILAGRDFHGQVAGGAVHCRPIFHARYQTSGGGGVLRRAVFAAAARLPPPLAACVAPPLRELRRRLSRGMAPDGFGEELAAAVDGDGGEVVVLHSASAANLAGLPSGLRVKALCLVLRRTPTEMDRDEPAPQPIGTVLRELVVRFGTRLRIFADTAELAALYAPLSDAPVGVAPLPVVVPPLSHRLPHDPPHLVFAGGARAEKGYARLPALVEALRGKVRFTIHSGPVDAAADPLVQRAHRALRRCVGPDMALVEHGLAPNAYQALLADADLLLLPYDAVAYGPRSSGILAEARALGVPAVVPAGCWMESAAGPVQDVIFHGEADFNPTVSRVLEALPSVTAALREAAPLWRRQHSPEALLQTLLPSPLLSSRPEAGKRGVKIYG